MRVTGFLALLRGRIWLVGTGLLLAGCSTAGTVALSHNTLAARNACQQIGPLPTLPTPQPGVSSLVNVSPSLLTALRNSRNASLEHVAREIVTAESKGGLGDNGEAVVRALEHGVKVCRNLGMPTRH